jgi:oligoendopeptidase F
MATNRQDVSAEFKWDLTAIFANQEAWEEMFAATEVLIYQAEKHRGQVTQSSQTLLAALQWTDQVSANLEELFTYARMKRDEDNREAFYQNLTGKAMHLAVMAGSELSFLLPELLAADTEKLEAFRVELSEQGYGYYLEEIIRQKPHVLSPAEEKILAEATELAEAPGTIFSMLNDADIKFGLITNEKGEKTELTKGNYTLFLESSDRRVREEAFHTLYCAYEAQINTLAAILGASVKADCFQAKQRRHSSSLEASLFADDVPLGVYEALIETVHAFLPVFYRYMDLRQRVLAVDELHMYDLYTPLLPDEQVFYTWEEAKSLVREALQPLGAEYLAALDQGFTQSWIDVRETEGKTSGAYSWGTYGSHPYVLLNHQDNLNSLFTLAHEMGHALHTWYSHRQQPHHYAGYKIFVAEVASTVNETLLSRLLIDREQDKRRRAYLINHYLEQFRGTVFRQTMFAEFEKITHEAVESGESLTAEFLSAKYRRLNELYYGDHVMLDQEIEREWARIPHFYNAFYVYKYATGFSAATALATGILTEGEPAAAGYREFLSGGSSAPPLELLRRAGVDMSAKTPIEKALTLFADMVTELETIM